jgi:predicted transcriptional regulator
MVSKNQQLREWRERLGLNQKEVVKENIGVYYSTLRRIEKGEIDLEHPTKKMANVVNTLEEYYTKRDQVKRFRKLKGVK